MSIIDKLTKAITNQDANLANEVIHDEYKFLLHASKKTLNKQDVVNWLESGDVTEENVRVLFENEKVGFKHAFVTFKDGNKEAVMSYFKFKDGKVIYQETGATKISKK